MGKDLYTAAQFIDAIKGSAGIVSTIAARVGCEWSTAKKYIDNYPTIKAAYIDETEKVTDIAEAALIGAIQDKEMWAVKYYLSTKGKGRGYTERHEVTGADGGPVVIVNWDATTNQD